MRAAPIIALSAAAVMTVALASRAAEAQSRRSYDARNTERITVIDENGRARTRITVRPRSYLDGGTYVFTGERKFADYAWGPTYAWSSPSSSWDPTGSHRSPLPMPFDLPGFNPYLPY